MRPNLAAIFLSYVLYIFLILAWVVFEGVLSFDTDKLLHSSLGFNFSSLFVPIFAGLIVGFICSKFRASKKYMNIIYLGIIVSLTEIIGEMLLIFSPRYQAIVNRLNSYYLPDPDWVSWCVFIILPVTFLVGAWIQYKFSNVR